MKKSFFVLASLAVVLTVPGLSSVTLAYRGDPNAEGPNYSPERHAAMLKAFEAKDYSAWNSLMQGKGGVARAVNQDNFARFVEMRTLMLEGKTDEAAQIRQELDLGMGQLRGGHGRMSR